MNRDRTDIEDFIGRPLTPGEHGPVASLDSLSAEQLALVLHLRQRNLVEATFYLRWLGGFSVAECKVYLDQPDCAFDPGFENPPMIKCACGNCSGVFRFEGTFKNDDAILVCSSCACCYRAPKVRAR